MGSKKGFTLIILVLLVIVGVIFAGYFYFQNQQPQKLIEKSASMQTVTPTPTPIISKNEKTGWNIYSNEKLKFQIEYPQEASRFEKQNGVEILQTGPSQGQGELYDGYSLDINAFPLNNQSLNEIPTKEIEKLKNIGKVEVPLHMIEFAGVSGYSYTATGLGTFTYYFLPGRDNNYFVLGYIVADPKNQGFKTTMDKILSTFTLIPKMEGNSITVDIKNPFYSPNNEGILKEYKYTFSYNYKTTDVVTPTDYGIDIARGNIVLNIRVPFEGVAIAYNQKPEAKLITGIKFTDKPVYQLKAKELGDDYYHYMGYYEEAPNGCKQHQPLPVACSSSDAYGYNIICKSDAVNVSNCDNIVKSLTITNAELK